MERKAAETSLAVRRTLNMPLLTELGGSEDGLCYKHGAPNGALPPGQHPIPLQIAKCRDGRTPLVPGRRASHSFLAAFFFDRSAFFRGSFILPPGVSLLTVGSHLASAAF